MKKTYKITIVVAVVIAAVGLLFTAGCKNNLQDWLFEAQGDWVFNVEAPGTEFTINYTFTEGRVYLDGIDVGRYMVYQVNIIIEVTRTLDTGVSVREEYTGIFDDNSNMQGLMSRYFDALTYESYTWKALR